MEQQGEVVIPPIRQVLSAELQAYLERIQTLLRQTQALPDDEPGGAFCGWLPADKGALLLDMLTWPAGQRTSMYVRTKLRSQSYQLLLQCSQAAKQMYNSMSVDSRKGIKGQGKSSSAETTGRASIACEPG